MKNYLFFILLISFLILVGTARASNNTTDLPVDNDQPYPSIGGDIHDIFDMRHFGALYDPDVKAFIDAYGLGYFYERPACDFNQSYYFVYLLPEKDYPKELVFLEFHDSKGINNSVIWVKLLEKNTEVTPLNDSECIALGIIKNGTEVTINPPGDNSGTVRMLSFAIGLAILLILLLALVIIRNKMRW
ncbi:MAG: hypothetical protein WBZ29_06110 [Methanocella sp.]